MTQIECRLNNEIRIVMDYKLLVEKQTEFQNIKIIDTEIFGKVLLIDNIIQLSEKDETLYHETIVHPAMAIHSEPSKVLVIGGGDGGVIREVLKHPVKEVVLVEIDKEVIELVNKEMPIAKNSFKDKRLKILYEDGEKYIKETKEKFDIIFLDLTDPELVDPIRVSASDELFTTKFYKNVKKVLKPKGIIVSQTDSPVVEPEETKQAYNAFKKTYKEIIFYDTFIPSFFTVQSFCIVSDSKMNTKNIAKVLEKNKIKLKANSYKQIQELLEPKAVDKLFPH